MICLLVAPTAFRKPTSNVRSVTLTSMMFITTMPPTMRVISVIGTTTFAMPLVNVDLIVEFLHVHQTKIIFFVSIQPMFDPHRHASIFDRRLQSFSSCDSCHESADCFARRPADEW